MNLSDLSIIKSYRNDTIFQLPDGNYILVDTDRLQVLAVLVISESYGLDDWLWYSDLLNISHSLIFTSVHYCPPSAVLAVIHGLTLSH